MDAPTHSHRITSWYRSGSESMANILYTKGLISVAVGSSYDGVKSGEPRSSSKQQRNEETTNRSRRRVVASAHSLADNQTTRTASLVRPGITFRLRLCLRCGMRRLGRIRVARSVRQGQVGFGRPSCRFDGCKYGSTMVQLVWLRR